MYASYHLQNHRRTLQLRGTGSFQIMKCNARQESSMHTSEIVNRVLQRFAVPSQINSWSVKAELGIRYETVWKIMREEYSHPFHVQKMQHLGDASDYSFQADFVRWILMPHRIIQSLANALFLDEAWFTRESVINSYISHIWSSDNSPQHCLVKSWTQILYYHQNLLGSYFLSERLNEENYLIFIEHVIPDLLKRVPATLRQTCGLCIMMQQHILRLQCLPTLILHIPDDKFIGHSGFGCLPNF